MDLTPQDVRDVQFREKMRGYHQDDVDQFLVQVASTLERLHLRLQEVEVLAAEGTSRSDEIATTEESLKRTLLLAQRTADLAMQEAREEADRLLSDARAEHERLRTHSAEIKRQLIEESQGDIRAELAVLEARRDALVEDLAVLESFVASERARLATTLQETLGRLEAGAFDLQARPSLQVDVAPVAAPGGDARQELAEPGIPANADGATLDDEGPPTEAMSAVDGVDPSDAAGADVDLRDPADDEDAPGGAMDEPGADPAGDGGESDQGGPQHDDSVNDAFLAELRRAVTDEEPLGPRADETSHPGRGDDDEIDFYQRDREASGRIGSRLRRRR